MRGKKWPKWALKREKWQFWSLFSLSMRQNPTYSTGIFKWGWTFWMRFGMRKKIVKFRKNGPRRPRNDQNLLSHAFSSIIHLNKRKYLLLWSKIYDLTIFITYKYNLPGKQLSWTVFMAWNSSEMVENDILVIFPMVFQWNVIISRIKLGIWHQH